MRYETPQDALLRQRAAYLAGERAAKGQTGDKTLHKEIQYSDWSRWETCECRESAEDIKLLQFVLEYEESMSCK